MSVCVVGGGAEGGPVLVVAVSGGRAAPTRRAGPWAGPCGHCSADAAALLVSAGHRPPASHRATARAGISDAVVGTHPGRTRTTRPSPVCVLCVHASGRASNSLSSHHVAEVEVPRLLLLLRPLHAVLEPLDRLEASRPLVQAVGPWWRALHDMQPEIFVSVTPYMPGSRSCPPFLPFSRRPSTRLCPLHPFLTVREAAWVSVI